MAATILPGGGDRSLLDNLKMKYSQPGGPAPDAGLDAAINQQVASLDATCCNSGDCSRQRKTAQDVDVKQCAKCQGIGEIREHYNYRVLTNPCETCDGTGVLTFRKGKLVTEDKTAPPPKTNPSWRQTSRERISTLEKDVAKITAKRDLYKEEIASLRASLAGGGDSVEQTIKEDLISELERQVASLGVALERRQRSLDRYRNPETVAGEEEKEVKEEMPHLEAA